MFSFGILTILLLILIIKTLFGSVKWNHFAGYKSYSSLPLIGHAYVLGKDPIQTLMKCYQEFGPIFRLDIGNLPTVILCSYDDALAALKSDVFNGRPWDNVYAHYAIRGRDCDNNIAGMVACSGRAWRNHRKFLTKNINELGDKSKLEEICEEESRALCESLAREDGKNLEVTHRFLMATNGVVWRLLTGKQADQHDPELNHLTQCVSQMFQCLSPSSLNNLLQQRSKVFCKFLNFFGIKSIIEYGKPLIDMISNVVDEYGSDDQGNIIERYKAEIESSSLNENSLFHGVRGQTQMKGGIFDLFIAATDTCAALIEWVILYLVMYPDVQEKIVQELKSVVGNRDTILEDRRRTHYFNAFMEEIMRHCPQLQINVPHLTHHDTTFRGYFFPAGTQVITFHGAIHFNKRYFKDPEIFNPERFLDSEGNFHPCDKVIFYGLGKRRCAGEVLARAETYIFASNLIKTFKFSAIEGTHLDLTYLTGLLSRPKRFSVKLQLRG